MKSKKSFTINEILKYDQTIEKLKKLSKKEVIENMEDLFGENPDDAYYRGLEDGKVHLAQEILNDLNIKYD